MKKRKFINILTALCAILFLVNCGDDGDDGPWIKVDNTTIQLDADGTGVTVMVESNTTWNVSSNDSWLSCSPAGGQAGQLITISANVNTGAERKSKITIKDKTGLASAEIMVVQSGSVTPNPDPDETTKLFEEPYLNWGAHIAFVKSFMAGYTVGNDGKVEEYNGSYVLWYNGKYKEAQIQYYFTSPDSGLKEVYLTFDPSLITKAQLAEGLEKMGYTFHEETDIARYYFTSDLKTVIELTRYNNALVIRYHGIAQSTPTDIGRDDYDGDTNLNTK